MNLDNLTADLRLVGTDSEDNEADVHIFSARAKFVDDLQQRDDHRTRSGVVQRQAELRIDPKLICTGSQMSV